MKLVPPDPKAVRRAVEAALGEDLGARGDITTEAVIPGDLEAAARLIARCDLVVAGLPVARRVFNRPRTWSSSVPAGTRSPSRTLASNPAKAPKTDSESFLSDTSMPFSPVLPSPLGPSSMACST